MYTIWIPSMAIIWYPSVASPLVDLINAALKPKELRPYSGHHCHQVPRVTPCKLAPIRQGTTTTSCSTEVHVGLPARVLLRGIKQHTACTYAIGGFK